jgi:hypothetical protein
LIQKRVRRARRERSTEKRDDGGAERLERLTKYGYQAYREVAGNDLGS